MRIVRSIVGLGLAAVLTPGCLSATPPKTPNQRAAERAAPRVEPPPPPDAGRVPVPETSPAIFR